MSKDHLSSTTREFLDTIGPDPGNEKRIRHIQEDKWINYGAAVNVSKKVDRIKKAPLKLRPQCLLVKGDPQNGKSSMRDMIFKLYDLAANPDKRPVIQCQMPADPNVNKFLNSLLVALGIGERPTNKSDSLLRQLLRHLGEYEVELIIIDEFHHIGRCQDRVLRVLLDSIKDVTTMSQLPILAFGVKSAGVIISKDSQIDSRFDQVELPLWTENQDYLRLLASFETLLPLKKPSVLTNEELAVTILSRTNRTIGEISRLLEAVSIAAIESGEEQITLDMVKEIPFHSCKSITFN